MTILAIRFLFNWFDKKGGKLNVEDKMNMDVKHPSEYDLR